MPEENAIWSNVLETLRENISEQGFNTWFSETTLLSFNNNQLKIKVPTQFIADYLNKNYSELISEICYNLYNIKYGIKFTGTQSPIVESNYLEKYKKPLVSNHQTKLNINYNFNEFVIGTNNKFAQSASLAVAEAPGNT